MKAFIIILSVASSLAAPQGLPVFEVNGHSRSNVPQILVTFANGVTDEMLLEPYSESPCNFIGYLKNEPGSSVAVTGCLENPKDTMHFTLLSDKNTLSAAYIMDFNGLVTADENPFEYQTERTGKFPLKSRAGGSGSKCNNGDEYKKKNDEMGDEEEDDLEELLSEAALKTGAANTMPPKLYAYLKFGYDTSLKQQLSQDGTNFNTWIDSVMTHVQSYYRHSSLPSKIEFKYDVNEAIFKNEYLPSVEADSLNAWTAYAGDDIKNNPKVDLYVTFGKDPNYYGTVGLAWVGTACKSDGYGTSFNEHRNTPAATAGVAAHEMGHNFGMLHDFDDKHSDTDCNGQGIMSYGDPPNKWSSCSVEDFLGFYELKKWGETCLKDWNAYCGDKCAKCDLGVDLCADPEPYGGCKGRYKHYFEAYCAGTCGLCENAP